MAVLEEIVSSDLGSALASLLSDFFRDRGEVTLTPGQHLRATMPVNSISIKERRHRKTNPPWAHPAAAAFQGSKLGEAAGLLAAGGERVKIRLLAVSVSFRMLWTFGCV